MKQNFVQKTSANTNAISAWQKAIGSEHALSDTATISSYESATYKTDISITAVLTPKNAEEVQECVRIANEYKIPLYPISKGKNWGYGSKVPAENGCAVISLERMNSITDFSEDLAYITVEPGVTFQQVYDFLKEKNSNLIAPTIGSTSEASLVGNALERGIGKGNYGDRFNFSCNIEVVLPNGEIINTGFGNILNAHSKNVYKWGLGPSIDGIFTQSNFGIVTKMTFWLCKKPVHFQAIFYTIKNNEQLVNVVEALRTLRLEGTLTTTSTLSNSSRVLSMKQQFPWKDISDNNTCLPQEYLEKVQRESLQGAIWIGDDAILAQTKAIGKARAKRVKQVLGSAAEKVVFIDSNKARIAKFLHKPLKALISVDMRELLYFFYNSIYLGHPMDKQLSICYFRKKTPVPEKIDPDKDKCGVMWLSPSVPFQGEHVKKVLGILESLYKKYQFEPNIGLNFMSDRAIAFTSAIIYDREVEGHDLKAMECYKEMLQTLLDAGYPPYRLGVQSMDDMISTSPEYVNFINKLKAAIDPNNIISPNHYGTKGS